MKKMCVMLGAVPLAAALVACGGGNGSDAGSPSATPSEFSSASAVADAAHLQACKDSTPSNGKGWMTEVSCGQRAVVLQFDKDGDKVKFVENWLANEQEGDAAVLVGTRWAINCPERNTCSNLKGIIGGNLKP